MGFFECKGLCSHNGSRIGKQTAGEWLKVLYLKYDLQDYFVNYEHFNSVCYFHNQNAFGKEK